MNGTGAAASKKFRSTPFHGSRRAFAVHSRPWGSSGEGSAAQAVAMPRRIFPGTPLGRRRFLGALSLASGAMAWRRALFQCAAGRAAAYRPYGRVRALPWFSFGLTPSKGKVAVFLKESRLKNFYARCARRPVSLLYDLFRLMAPLEQRLPQGASRCLAMADGQGQGVGGIVGLGDFLQP